MNFVAMSILAVMVVFGMMLVFDKLNDIPRWGEVLFYLLVLMWCVVSIVMFAVELL